jgi:hypothetical protein
MAHPRRAYRGAAALLSVVALAGCGGGGDAQTDTRGPSAGVPIPGGGLTVSEAIASGLEGPLQVKGYVIDGRLCEAILESYPPQCGEPSLRIDGDVEADFEDERGVRWTDEQVSVLGEVEDGVIRISETST